MVNDYVNLNNLLFDVGCRLLMIGDKYMYSFKKIRSEGVNKYY